MLQNIKFLLLFSSYWNKEKEKENKIKSFIDAIDAIPEWNLFQAMAGRNKNDMASKLFRFKGAVSAQKNLLNFFIRLIWPKKKNDHVLKK